MPQDLAALFGLKNPTVPNPESENELLTEVVISSLPHELGHVSLIERFYHDCANAKPELENNIGATMLSPGTLMIAFAVPVKESFLRQKLEPLVTSAVMALGKTSGYGLSFSSDNIFMKNFPKQQSSVTSDGPNFG